MVKTYRIENLVELLGVSRATLDRWLAEARRGENDIPLPFSKPGRRMIWTAEAIESWIEHRQSAASMLPVTPKSKNEKQKANEWLVRQQKAQVALEQHRTGKHIATSSISKKRNLSKGKKVRIT